MESELEWYAQQLRQTRPSRWQLLAVLTLAAVAGVSCLAQLQLLPGFLAGGAGAATVASLASVHARRRTGWELTGLIELLCLGRGGLPPDDDATFHQ